MEPGTKQRIRYSKKREAILTLLQSTRCHPTAEWLFQELKPQYPDLSLGTVYRNLSFFQDQGDIKSVGVFQGQERFDADTSPHGHFVCLDCGRVMDLPHLSLEEEIQAAMVKEYGFVVERHELHLYGRCEDCLKMVEQGSTFLGEPLVGATN